MSAPQNETMESSRQPTPPSQNGRPRPPGPEERRGATATSGGDGPKPPTMMDTLRSPRFWITVVAIGILYFFILPIIFPANNDRVTLSYTAFREQVRYA